MSQLVPRDMKGGDELMKLDVRWVRAVLLACMTAALSSGVVAESTAAPKTPPGAAGQAQARPDSPVHGLGHGIRQRNVDGREARQATAHDRVREGCRDEDLRRRG